MGFPPHKGKDRSGPEAPAAGADRPQQTQEGSKVIQYPRPDASSVVPAEASHQRLSRPGETPELGSSVAERNVEEWRVIAAVLQGDVIEFRTLVHRYQDAIYHLMLRVTGQPMTAEDLTQDAFTRAYEKLNTFKKGKRFFSWLYTIAANIGRDHLRRRGLQNDLFTAQPLDAAWPDPNRDDCARQPDCVVEVAQISEALARLPARYSETMLLYYREGMRAKEIAKALHISTAAVKVRIYRGRKLLQQKMRGQNENN